MMEAIVRIAFPLAIAVVLAAGIFTILWHVGAAVTKAIGVQP